MGAKDYNYGDADKTFVLGDGNVQRFATTFTASRTISLPAVNNGMCAGLYYDLIFYGSINDANTAVIKSSTTTLATLSTDKVRVRFTHRRNASNAKDGWIMTGYETLP